jgi:hypothetical protein
MTYAVVLARVFLHSTHVIVFRRAPPLTLRSIADLGFVVKYLARIALLS